MDLFEYVGGGSDIRIGVGFVFVMIVVVMEGVVLVVEYVVSY